MSLPKVRLSEFTINGHSYTYEDKQYPVVDIIKLAKEIESFDLPLAGINLSCAPWGEQNIMSICGHMKRVNEADMSHPIILDDEGYICDGWHRVCKAILEGREIIKAVRLEVMPDRVG
ncbi:MAG: hypothetical protein COB36_10710 [Alphaproteobacteria bacterium]|nr:MAG: hypothetical protein COB36_10710 [Alphaproteobacteria bacterium]